MSNESYKFYDSFDMVNDMIRIIRLMDGQHGKDVQSCNRPGFSREKLHNGHILVKLEPC